ncbi:MAG: hypothetical protein IKP76_04395 [Bacilli bacterium]|nr:hypothetical protein [Bacilli bacterium]
MNNDLKIILLGFLACITLVASFILFFNDVISYSILCAAVTVLLIGYLIYTVFSGKSNKAEYDAKLKNVLKTYDEDIIYAETDYEIKEKNVLFVKSLDDLLVATSITGTPIIYIAEDEASTFLVKNDEDLLAYILKVNPNKETKYEKILKDKIENNKKNVNSLLNNITKETIIVIDNKSYKVSPVAK